MGLSLTRMTAPHSSGASATAPATAKPPASKHDTPSTLAAVQLRCVPSCHAMRASRGWCAGLLSPLGMAWRERVKGNLLRVHARQACVHGHCHQ